MDIMKINRLQQISLGVAVAMVLANKVYVRNCKRKPGGCYEYPNPILFNGFLIALGVLLLASMYEVVFSNTKQGLLGIGLMVVTILVTMSTTQGVGLS